MTKLSPIFGTSAAILACVVMLSLGGCNLSAPYPVRNEFVIRVKPGPKAQETVPGVIMIAGVRVAGPFGDREFVYRMADLTFKSDYYNLFIVAPGRMLTGEVVYAMRQRHGFNSVLDPDVSADHDWVLETMVTDLYGDYRDPSAPRAVVRAHFVLLRVAPASTTVVGEWTFEESEPLGAPTPAELAAACGVAFGAVLQRAAPEIEHAASTQARGAGPR